MGKCGVGLVEGWEVGRYEEGQLEEWEVGRCGVGLVEGWEVVE